MNRAIRAKNTAIAAFWTHSSLAAFTFIEKLAGIGRHRFLFLVPTIWTSYYGLKDGLLDHQLSFGSEWIT